MIYKAIFPLSRRFQYLQSADGKINDGLFFPDLHWRGGVKVSIMQSKSSSVKSVRKKLLRGKRHGG